VPVVMFIVLAIVGLSWSWTNTGRTVILPLFEPIANVNKLDRTPISPTRVTRGNRALYGTFKDYAGEDGPPNNGIGERSCTGDLTASQTAPKDRYQLKVTWKVTGGKNCNSIGKTFSLDFSESLPSADAKGNFQFQNASVWTGLGPNQSTLSMWERWQVVDDGLNCRARPNGAIVRTYRRGEQFLPLYEGRGGNPTAFLGSENTEATPDQVRQFKGDPWIRTRAKCYVRSNSQYIQPLSFSQPFKP
jgi:hypothetical protein